MASSNAPWQLITTFNELEKGVWWRHRLIGEVTQSMEDTLTASTSGIDELLVYFSLAFRLMPMEESQEEIGAEESSLIF
jgi:hypothetical protein